MQKIETTSAFRRDFKRMKTTPKFAEGEALLASLLKLLVADELLPIRYRDHALSHDWKDHRECHVRPDLLLIYRQTDGLLQLVRLGSHSELFGK